MHKKTIIKYNNLNKMEKVIKERNYDLENYLVKQNKIVLYIKIKSIIIIYNIIFIIMNILILLYLKIRTD
jgi:hypothetical protein